MSMIKLNEIVQAIQQILHITKPLLFELALYSWALIELAKFVWHVAAGGAE